MAGSTTDLPSPSARDQPVADRSVAFPAREGQRTSSAASRPRGLVPWIGEATAERLQVTVTPPRSEPGVARRTFDRVPGTSVTRGNTRQGVGRIDLLVDLDGSGDADYPPMRGVKAFAIATGPTSALPALTTSDDGLGMLRCLPPPADAVAADIALERVLARSIDNPNVVSVSVDVYLDDGGRHPWPRARRPRHLASEPWGPAAGGTVDHPRHGQLVAGVTDYVAERFALSRWLDEPDGPPGEVSVGAVFEAAAAQGIPTIVPRGRAGCPPLRAAGARVHRCGGRRRTSSSSPRSPSRSVAQRVSMVVVDPVTARPCTMDDGTGAPAMAEYETTVQTRLGVNQATARWGATIAVELAGVINVQLLHLRSLNTFSQLRRASRRLREDATSPEHGARAY